MLEITALLFFYVLSVFLIYAIIRDKKISLSATETAVIFAFKVLMGCLYGFIFLRYYGGDDTWVLHQGSLQEYRKLMTQPLQFFADADLTASFRRNEGFAAGWYYLLSDLEYWIITKPLAVFNMFSRGNYYINVVFFNLLTFWGQYLLFKLFAAQFPDRRRLILVLVFFVPSVAFWLSGIRPDAWIMVSLGVTLFYYYKWLQLRRGKDLLAVVAGLMGLIIFRSPLMLVLLPGLLAWFITVQTGRPAWVVFLVVYLAGVAAVFSSAYFMPGANVLDYIVRRQQEFLGLKGNTVFELNVLEPEPASFLATLPQAFANTFLRPYFWEARGALQWMAAGEVMLFWILLLMSVVSPARPGYGREPLVWMAVFFGVGLYIFIGYTIPFPGAIVRYKVIAELLLLLAICLRFKSNKKI